MNVIGLFIIVGLYAQNSQAQQFSQNQSKIERFLYDRCRKHSAEAASYDNVKEHLSQFSDYSKYTASLLPKGKKQFCNDEKKQLVSLMAELTKDLKTCFPKEERYLPAFMYEMFVNFMEFICSSRNIENFFSTQGADCRSSLKTGNAGEDVGNCFKKFFTGFNELVQKDDLCLNLRQTESCFGVAITQYCNDFRGYESLNKKFFHAIQKPCTDKPETTRLPLDKPETTRLPLDKPETTRLPPDKSETTRLPLDKPETTRLPLDKPETTRLPLDEPNSGFTYGVSIVLVIVAFTTKI